MPNEIDSNINRYAFLTRFESLKVQRVYLQDVIGLTKTKCTIRSTNLTKTNKQSIIRYVKLLLKKEG
jgi:hypothetical protein